MHQSIKDHLGIIHHQEGDIIEEDVPSIVIVIDLDLKGEKRLLDPNLNLKILLNLNRRKLINLKKQKKLKLSNLNKQINIFLLKKIKM